MPRRPLLTLGAALLPAVLLTSCGGPDALELRARPTQAGTGSFCSALRDSAPASVAGQPLRRVRPERAGLAWGDPAIVLRCGVPRPAALRPDSALADVDGIGWLDEERPGGALRFTTTGLPAYVEVTVPADYRPQADALVDLASALRRAAR